MSNVTLIVRGDRVSNREGIIIDGQVRTGGRVFKFSCTLSIVKKKLKEHYI